MKFVVTAFVSLLLAGQGSGQQQIESIAVKGNDRYTEEGFEQAADTAAKRIDDTRLKTQVPGMSAAVWLRDRVVWAQGLGHASLSHQIPTHPETRFRLGSVSKIFTATLAAKLAALGYLEIDQNVRESVEQCPASDPPITLRHLLGHLGGIRHYDSKDYAPDRPGGNIDVQLYPTTKDALAIFAGDDLVAPPGTRFSYTTFGFTLIRAVLEEETGETFEDLLQEFVLDPLEIETLALDRIQSITPHLTDFYEISEGEVVRAFPMNPAYKWAGGGMVCTAQDMARFGAAHFVPGFLPEAMFEEVFVSQTNKRGDHTGTGLGWRISRDAAGRKIYHHGGSQAGCRAILMVWPDQECAVAIMSNLTGTPGPIGDLAKQVGADFLLLAPNAQEKSATDNLKAELARRLEQDQAVRREAAATSNGTGRGRLSEELAARWERVDRENVAYLEQVIERWGWPGQSLVGENGALTAFLFAQHADKRPKFQARCLELITEAADQGEASPANVAYLTDRVRLAQGKPQVYGTQVEWVEGTPRPQNLEDPDKVDERRAKVGLSPLSEYLKMMQGGG